MASKRILKKNLLKMVIDVVEESYSAQLYDTKKTKKSDKLIEDVLDFHDEMRTKISLAKNKKDMAPIRSIIEERAIDFIQQVNSLN